MTQEEVGNRSGVHPTEVSRIEGGKRDPQVSTVQKLVKAVGLSASDLLR
jgi:transcriptional regulator with XRE-family HTH domain